MKSLTTTAAVIFTLCTVSSRGEAQYWGGYWGERVLEKGFEQTEFFFTPSYVVPYGIGNFSETTPGLLQDPLMDLVSNPARLSLDSLKWNYLYTDFRSARTIREEQSPVYPMMARSEMASVDMIYRYPAYFLSTRRALEPVFSGAYIVQLLPSIDPELYVGATYQLVMNDDKYYSIPQDIYRTTAGLDYNGRSVAAGSSVPIVDRYSGKDNIGQTGHFASLFTRYAIPEQLDLGFKLSRVFFRREGEWGSSNLWESSYSSPGSTSVWSNMEAREQAYDHWDLEGGVEYHAGRTTTLGLSVGYLWGVVTQSLRNRDSSYYAYSSTSVYTRSAPKLQQWDHQGRMTYVGVDLSTHPSPATTFSLLYRGQWSTVDIGVAAAIIDTSRSTYSNSTSTDLYTSNSRAFLSDMRDGSGDQVFSSNRVMAALQWKLDGRVTLSLGAQLELQRREISTVESVEMVSRSRYWYSSSTGSSDWYSMQNESKDLLWTFSAKRTSFRVPVFVDIQASEKVGILLGLSRDMAQWKIDDVTLAMFRYRNIDNNGSATTQSNFGERYTTPTEEVTDVRTTFLAGLTVAPSPRFQVRVLMVPNFRDTYDGSELDQLQWWVGLTVRP